MTLRENKIIRKLIAGALVVMTVLTVPLGAFADTSDVIDVNRKLECVENRRHEK